MSDLLLLLNKISWPSLILFISLLSTGILILFPAIRQKLHHAKIEKAIARLGKYQMKNVLLDDGVDGKVFIELLCLTPDGLLVLSKDWRKGNIFGGEFLDNWAQIINKKTFHFKNPLYVMTHTVAGLQHHAPDLKVSAKVLFMADCSFPKGQPENTLLLKDIMKTDYSVNYQQKDTINDVLEQTWITLKNHSEKADKSMIYEKKSKLSISRILSSLVLIALSFYWLYLLLR